MPELYFPNGSITIDGDAFTAEVSSAILTPTAPTSSFTDIGGNTTKSVGDPDWSLALTIGQDLVTDGSLSVYLIEHHGEVKDVVFTPQAGGRSFTVEALIVAGAIGGASGAQATSQVTFPVNGQPTLAPAEGAGV